MTHREEPADHIRKARNLVATAEKCWNAGSTGLVEQCLAALEESAAELREAQTTGTGRRQSLAGLRDEILQIKAAVTRIENLSELAAAFLGGGPSGGGSPLYRAGGFEDTGNLPMQTTIVQAW